MCEALVAGGYRERVRAAVAELVLPTPPAAPDRPGEVACVLVYGQGLDIEGSGASWADAYQMALDGELKFLDADPGEIANCWGTDPPDDPGAYLQGYLDALVPLLITGPRALEFAEQVVS